MMRKCVIDSIRASLTNQQRLVILKDEEQELFLPIWIGMYEAEAIAIALQKIEFARPQTHALISALLTALNTQLIQIEITALKENVFFASLILEREGQRIPVDCRPSDAIVMAARAGVPIFVDEAILREAGIEPGEEAADTEDSEEEEANLDVYSDFLNSLGDDSTPKPDEPGEDDSPF